MQVTIRDAMSNKIITGKLVKKYANGVSIDSASNVRYYATERFVIEPKFKTIPLHVED